MKTILILFSLSVAVIFGAVYIAYEKIKCAYKKRNDEIEILKRNLDINNLIIEKKLRELNESLDIDTIPFNSTMKKKYKDTRNIVNTSINTTISSVQETR
ncbi:MAG: hypothetical protein KID00_07475 [Clostridium argentinense]|uniref:Uncharacterized protein n=1 Tax=Clostridium faecium TaxID=2762223 RepID=A0ABR8YUC1_9CLOT|nr:MULTISPECIES: hypothetical protein [Clostridium]MBD8047546.1 hypothetical protein [Clostridium faecium]MBS5823690.1 hypothetical protein [Clostridium argentinense]MDU1348803.1 hypothetical protein [Clostridium argentinense]